MMVKSDIESGHSIYLQFHWPLHSYSSVYFQTSTKYCVLRNISLLASVPISRLPISSLKLKNKMDILVNWHQPMSTRLPQLGSKLTHLQMRSS